MFQKTEDLFYTAAEARNPEWEDTFGVFFNCLVTSSVKPFGSISDHRVKPP
jgi:hypothetical protein